MTFYETEIKRISSIAYANQEQLNTVIATRKYMDSNYDADVNLDMLSYAGFVSKFHLLRLFKRYYGQTPRQYLTDKRIERSKEYLKQGMNITETCFAIGFEAPSSFSTLFKRRTGLTPTEFVKKEQFSQRRCGADAETLQQ